MKSSLKQGKAGTFSTDWFSRNIELWKNVLGHLKEKEIRVLEVGVFEGRSTIWILKELFSNPKSQLTVIDSFVMGSKHRFLANIKTTGKHSQVNVITSNSREVLLKLNSQKTKAFDFIYIDGGHDSQTVLNDAILGWALLAPAGIMIFDDYDLREVEPAINALLRCYVQEIEIIHIGHQVVLKRIKGGFNSGNIHDIKLESDAQTLNLSCNFIDDTGIKEIIQRFPLLTSLDLSNNQIGPIGAKIIAQSLPKLQNLDLSNNYIGDQGAQEIGNNLTQLKSLNLCENQIGVEGGKVIGKNLKSLTTLNLHENKIGKIGARYIGQNLLALRNLNLCGNQIGNEGAINILKNLPSLRILDLGGNLITIEGFKEISQCFAKLVSLSLCASKITDVELRCFFPYLINLSNLDLSENNLQFNDEIFFSENFSKLSRLNLRENKIGDVGLKIISQYCFNLKNLNLSFNKVSDEGINAITGKFLKLKLLDLHENQISFVGATNLCHTFPTVLLDLRGNSFSQPSQSALLDLRQKNPYIRFFYGNCL